MRRAHFGDPLAERHRELQQQVVAAAGSLRVADLKAVQIAGRALVYGFARMKIDGHFPRGGVADGTADRMAEAVVDLFIEGITKRTTTA